MVLANVVKSNKGVIKVSSVDIDGTTEIMIDGGGVSIDGTADSNLTVTGSAKDLDIAVAGGGAQELRLASAGTGANALSIDATAGSMVVAPSLADGQTLKLGKNGATEMVFTPHGTPASEKISLTNTAGTAANAIQMVASAGGIVIEGERSGGTAIEIDSTAGSITVGHSLADGQTLKIGKNGATEMIFTPHGTPASEKISLTNTAGTATDAISITSTAGGLTLVGGANDSSFTVSQTGKDLDLTVSGGGTQELRLNSAGTGDKAIYLNTTGSGGITLNLSAIGESEPSTLGQLYRSGTSLAIWDGGGGG